MEEAKLLSKIIDENNFYTLTKHNIDATDFEAYPHVYTFVKEYVNSFHQTPDYRTVVEKFSDFDYKADVSDSYVYLCKTIKSHSAKRKAVLKLGKVNEYFKTMSGEEFARWLKEEATALEALATSSSMSGTNYATNGEERKEWYNENKDTRSLSFIPTPYETLTQYLGGGFELGDMILLLAFTNRGKTWIGTDIGRVAYKSGFGVLHYSPELSKKQQVYRLDTLEGHFNNVDIRRGALDNEEEYFKFLDNFNEKNETPYIIKTMEDLPNGLSVEVIEADLQMYGDKIQMVVIDGLNLMKHPKLGHEGISATSRSLRQLFGRYGVAGLVVHQTTANAEREMNTEEDELDVEIPVPQLTDFSGSISTIQDSATVLTFNQLEGRGRIFIGKAREPNVGKSIDLRCQFNLGYITEASPVDYF
jgi:replicative DNA helicase